MNLAVEVEWADVYREINTRDYNSERVPYESLEAYLQNALIGPLTTALTAITADDLGRNALAAALKRVVLKSDGLNRGSVDCFAFADGVLTITQSIALDVSQSAEMGEALTKLFEKNL